MGLPSFDTSRVPNKDTKRVVQALRKAGHDLAWSGSGHIRIKHKETGAQYVLSSSPSDRNAVKAAVRDLNSMHFLKGNPLNGEEKHVSKQNSEIGTTQRGDMTRQLELRKLLDRQMPKYNGVSAHAARDMARFGIVEGLRLSRGATMDGKPVDTSLEGTTKRWRVKLDHVLNNRTVERWFLDNLELWLYSLDYNEAEINDALSGEYVISEKEFQQIVDDAVNADVAAAEEESTEFYSMSEMERYAQDRIKELEEELAIIKQDRDFLQSELRRQPSSVRTATPYWIKLATQLIGKVDAETFGRVVNEAFENDPGWNG